MQWIESGAPVLYAKWNTFLYKSFPNSTDLLTTRVFREDHPFSQRLVFSLFSQHLSQVSQKLHPFTKQPLQDKPNFMCTALLLFFADPVWFQIDCHSPILRDWVCKTNMPIIQRSRYIDYVCPKGWYSLWKGSRHCYDITINFVSHNSELHIFPKEDADNHKVITDTTPKMSFISNIKIVIQLWIPDVVYASDEHGCNFTSNNSTTVCISETLGFPLSICPLGTFECPDKSCVSDSYVCDGLHDCSDGTDEIGCSSVPCSPLLKYDTIKGCVPYMDEPQDVSDEWFTCGDGAMIP